MLVMSSHLIVTRRRGTLNTERCCLPSASLPIRAVGAVEYQPSHAHMPGTSWRCWRSGLVKLSRKTFLGQQDSSEKKWKYVFKFSPLKGDVFISGAEASFVHLLYFVLITAKRRRKGWRATCLFSSEEQGVHLVNLVDCTLLDGFGILHF